MVNPEFSHLSEKVAGCLHLSDDERIKMLDLDFWVDYPRADSILTLMEEIFNHPIVVRQPHLFITAPSNNGKTYLVTRFFKHHPIVQMYYKDRDYIPVIYIETPRSAKEDDLINDILTAIEAPFNPTETLFSRKQQAIKQMHELQTKIIIMDNLQNIHNAKPDKIDDFILAIRLLATCTFKMKPLGLSLFITGTPGAYDYLGIEAQLANRFDEITLPKWEYNMDCLKLLANLETMLPLREPSKLTEQTIAKHLLYASEGLIGEIRKILKLACKYAIRHNIEKITLDILNKIDYVKPSLRRIPYKEGNELIL